MTDPKFTVKCKITKQQKKRASEKVKLDNVKSNKILRKRSKRKIYFQNF